MVHLVDPDLKEMFFSYDYRRRLVQVRNGLNETTSMTFDGRGLLTSVLDANSRETRFFYRPSRQLWKITNALDETTEFSYFADGLLKSIKDAAGNEVFYEYDDADRLIQVVYPETDLVLPDFSRQNLSPQLRMAYDVWERLVALTSPNGNLEDTDNINLIGALNLLRNGGAELENGTRNQVPLGWEEDRPGGFVSNSVRSSADKLSGDYSFPLTVPDTLAAGQSHDWVQRRPAGFPGGRYVMKGTAKSDLATNFKLRAVVREFSGALSEQTGQVALSGDNTWTEATARVDLPGDAQITKNMPAMHQFRAGIEKPASGTAQAYLDDLKVLALSQVSHYDGEYAAGSTGPDGARVRVVRDRFGRPRRILDPSFRTVDFKYDVLGRILQVTDSQGLSLQYEWDFLGNLMTFIDSRLKETAFTYDGLGRVTRITQPDTDQHEDFSYTPGGDLLSYTNCRGQERQFFYDEAHRLIRIDYMLDPVESVSMTPDPVGNLLTLTERNGDQLKMSYDVLNRLQSTVCKSATGSRWALQNVFDSRGNRTALKKMTVYGMARYGQDRYGSGANVFTAQFNARNQMQSLKDGLDNETTFGFDADGRLAEVNHPTPTLQTRHQYDLVGKLLESRVTHNNTELWALNYEYNQSADRLRQTSRWADGGNCFEYELDSSGRLVQETLNRFVVNSLDAWAPGISERTRFDLDGKLRITGRADDLQAPYLDLQRWELAFTEPVATSVAVRQDQGLSFATSVGETRRNGRHMPAGTPCDSSNALTDYPHIDPQASDTVGWFEGRMLLRHRLPLEGEFDIEVSISEFDLFESSISLGVSRERFETADGASRYPTAFGGAANPDGMDIVVQSDGVRFNNILNSGASPSKLRLRRFLDGADWKLEGLYLDGATWVSADTVAFSGQIVYGYLHLSGKVGHVKFADFLATVGAEYPVSVVDSDEAVNQAAWPKYESGVYDAGHSVDWTRIAWSQTLPTNTSVRFQVAASESADGPFAYVGPDETGDTYFTTAAGQTVSAVTGRYGRFRAFLVSTDGLATPELGDVQLTHSGTSGSRVTRYAFDDAGNILEVAVTTDSGVVTDTRTYKDLNQLVTSSGGWTYQYDLDGNMTGKNNGAAEGNERWEFTWNEDARLVQVKKGVYDATPALVNEFTVDYQYDQVGRMLRRNDGTDVTTLRWDGWDLVGETTGTSVTEYLVPGLAVHSFIRDGVSYTLHPDALGSVRFITDESGNVVARFELSAYGEEIFVSAIPALANFPYRFVGALGVRTDSVTGLVWMRQRWYDPGLARFVSRDPIGLEGGANYYSYVENSPINSSDPSGLQPLPGPGPTPNPGLSGGMMGALDYNAIIRANATRTGVPPSVIAATLANELEYGMIQGPKDFLVGFLKSPGKISTGIGQIKPETAREIDKCAGRAQLSDREYRELLKTAESNIAYLADYLQQNVQAANKLLPGGFDRNNDYHWLGVAQAHNTGYPVVRSWDDYARTTLLNIRYYYTNVK
jgi:RHS repeat-associated protein